MKNALRAPIPVQNTIKYPNMEIPNMPEFDYSISERNILASVLHASDKFNLENHGDSPQVQPLSPALKQITKLEDLDAIHSCPLLDNVGEDNDEKANSHDGGQNESIADDDPMADIVLVRELIDQILENVGQNQIKSDKVVDDVFMNNMVNDLTNIAIPRCHGVHDIHSSSLSLVPHQPHPQGAPKAQNTFDEEVVAILDYSTVAKAATLGCSAELAATSEVNALLLSDRREGVGQSTEKLEYNIGKSFKFHTLDGLSNIANKSRRYGSWTRIKRVFSRWTTNFRK